MQRSWIDWICLIIGIWIVVSPWVLGYSSFTPALWSNVIVGVLIFLIALWRTMIQ
ncbi:MAG: SPW repeat protein [Patescibacteria group bacterium]